MSECHGEIQISKGAKINNENSERHSPEPRNGTGKSYCARARLRGKSVTQGLRGGAQSGSRAPHHGTAVSADARQAPPSLDSVPWSLAAPPEGGEQVGGLLFALCRWQEGCPGFGSAAQRNTQRGAFCVCPVRGSKPAALEQEVLVSLAPLPVNKQPKMVRICGVEPQQGLHRAATGSGDTGEAGSSSQEASWPGGPAPVSLWCDPFRVLVSQAGWVSGRWGWPPPSYNKQGGKAVLWARTASWTRQTELWSASRWPWVAQPAPAQSIRWGPVMLAGVRAGNPGILGQHLNL